MGPFPYNFIDKKCYYMLFVDHYSKYMWLYTSKFKQEVTEIFSTLHPLLEKRFQTKIFVSLY